MLFRISGKFATGGWGRGPQTPITRVRDRKAVPAESKMGSGARGRRRRRPLLFLLAPLLLAASPASDLASAVRAFDAGDHATARAMLKPLAQDGSAVAETLLGVMAARGRGAPADPAAAAAWWLRAASRGYGPAQLALAKALAAGHGVARDEGRAWLWARLAMAAGGGSAAAARALAAQLAARLGRARLAALEAERAAWQPTGGD